MKIRQDAWGEADDLFLAETVLKHIKEGSTQLNAFEEAGDQLNRTSAACGFRWNAVLRQLYLEEMEFAKKERKQRSRLASKRNRQEKNNYTFSLSPSLNSMNSTSPSSLTMKDIIAYLTRFTPEQELELLRAENAKLRSELETVTKELQELKKTSSSIQEDYESMLQIMERARKMVAFAEEPPAPVKFKMERNGNLEKIAE